MISKNVYKYLNDATFLQQLDTAHIKTYYAKIHVLSWKQEEIMDSIQGKVISANINIDGNSSIRRTASLTMIADGVINDVMRVDNVISINKKMKLEIGFKNTTGKYTEYDILYFPLGIYVIGTAAITHGLDSVTVSLQLKDKMCLLNGQSGGIFPASVELHKMDTVDLGGNITTSYPTIYQIIVEVVNHFGGEDLSKILISDLSTRIKQVVFWNGDKPIYIQKLDHYVPLYVPYISTVPPTEEQQQSMSIVTKKAGQQIGYIIRDFTYPGELIADAGATITSILDNIIGVLGNYEYFYDVDGNFRFQEKKNFLNNTQATYILDILNRVGKDIPVTSYSIFDPMQAYILDYFTTEKAQYKFNGGELISSFNNSPQYQSIKNDFVIWGAKKLGDQELPIRYHLVIDDIPEIGNEYNCIKIYNNETDQDQFYVPIMIDTQENLPDPGQEGFYYYIVDKGKVVQWANVENENKKIIKKYTEVQTELLTITTADWRTELYFQGLNAEPLGLESNAYYAELKAEWPKIYDIENGCIRQEYVDHPQNLDYFLDMIDTSSKWGQFSVANIGRRTLVQNLGTDANCIFEPSIPEIVYIQNTSSQDSSTIDVDVQVARQEAIQMKLNFYQVSTDIFKGFSTTNPSYNSCYQQIRQMIQDYTSYNESISFTTLPIYYLEPNIRININDPDTNIYGDYLINSMSFTIDATSSMTVNATRVLEKI